MGITLDQLARITMYKRPHHKWHRLIIVATRLADSIVANNSAHKGALLTLTHSARFLHERLPADTIIQGITPDHICCMANFLERALDAHDMREVATWARRLVAYVLLLRPPMGDLVSQLIAHDQTKALELNLITNGE
jgi:hypothetical protein